MQLARIDGTLLTTVAHPSLRGRRMVICQPLDEAGRDEGHPVVAYDPLGAGLHQRVLFHTDGGATREAVGDERSPLRNMVCAIVDPAPSA
jgi:microcompartment protein CcmK/EutM